MNCPVALGAAYRRSRLENPNLTTEEFCYQTRMKIMRRELLAFGVPFRAASEFDILPSRGGAQDGVETLRERSERIHPSDFVGHELSLVDLCNAPDSDEEQLDFNGELEQSIGVLHNRPFEEWMQFSGERMSGWVFVRIGPPHKRADDVIVINALDGTKICRASDQRDEIERPAIRINELDLVVARYDGRLLAEIVDSAIGRTLQGDSLKKDERKLLRNSGRAVKTCLSVMKGLSPREELIVGRALEAMLRIRPSLPEIFEEFVKKRSAEQARFARDGRAKKRADPKSPEAALLEAIDLHAPRPIEGSFWKAAEACVDGVNNRLATLGHKPVSARTIERRLKAECSLEKDP